MLQKSFFHCKQSAILFFLLVTCFVTIGQNPFIAGTTTDISTSLNQSTTNLETANDVWAENNCANFKVWANEYGCSWSFVDACPHVTQTGVSALVASQAISNPDVAIVVDHPVSGDVYYALFVYYNPGDGKFYFDPWYVDGSGVLLPVGPPQILEASNVPPNPSENAIRIDANKNGNFVIVFDNEQTKTLKMIAGRIDPGVGPYLSTAGTDNGKSVIPRTSDCIMPDVSIEESWDEGTAGVYYTYLSNDFSTLVVGY